MQSTTVRALMPWAQWTGLG